MKHLKIHRVLAVILAGIFAMSAALSGTMAWADLSQHRTNIAEGSGAPKPGSALLQKYVTGTETPVPGAEFSLYKRGDDGVFVQIATYITGADGQVLASGLAPGEYYWQETRPAPGYMPETEDGQPKKYPFTILGDEESALRVVAYNSRRTGNLALTKTVLNSDGSALTQAQKDLLFEFTVTFSDGTSQKVYLKSGESKQFDVPVGTYYSITETPVEGYTTTSKNHAGNVPVGGITAEFTNTYGAAQPGSSSLTVKKTVTGEGADPARLFEFTAVIGDTTETFTLSHGQSKTFTDIPLGTAYTVTEAPAEGYTANPRQYSGVISIGGAEIMLPFVNHFDGENPPDLPGHLEISKTVIGTESDKAFTFTVVFEGEGAPDSPQTFTLKHGEKKTFSDIPRGVKYTVTEAAEEGFVADFTSASGTIAWGQTAAIAFINRVKPDEPDDLQLTVTKRVEGNPPAADSEKLFHFVLTINGKAHEFDLKPGETSAPFAVKTGDVYTLTERDYSADGYTQSGVINGSGTVGSVRINAIQINTYTARETIDITGEKTWQGSANRPESVTILLKNGSVVVASIETNQAQNWRYAFKNLPKHDALGNEILYTIEEVRVPGWMPIVTGTNIKNIAQNPVKDIEIEIEKAISGTPPEDETFKFTLTAINNAPMPEEAEISIKGAGSAKFGQIAYTQPGEYVYTITETDGGAANWSYDASVYTLTVTVTEDESGQLSIKRSLEKAGKPAEKALFTNRYDDSGERIAVRVTKVWKGEGEHPQSVQVQLYKDGTAYGNPATLSAANNWTRTWADLDKGHSWTVDELAVPEGYTKTISGDAVNGFTITNTKEGSGGETTSVKVTKVWSKDDETARPASIAVQLYMDGAAEGLPVTLSAANGWSYTWSLLKKGPAYTVDEANVPAGYSKAVTGDAANGFVITNTLQTAPDPDIETFTLTGKKTWNHGSNKAQPVSVTVILKANGVIIAQRRVTAAENWAWSFSPLPRNDQDGKKITYTIDEAAVESYTKTVDGYNLINTYSPGSTPTQPPKTSDESHLALWLLLMALSLAGLVTVLILSRRGSKKQRV